MMSMKEAHSRLMAFGFVFILSVLIHQEVTSLPPDFFRPGRSVGAALVLDNDNTDYGAKTVRSLCRYCSVFGEDVERRCLGEGSGKAVVREICLEVFLNDLQEYKDRTGWRAAMS